MSTELISRKAVIWVLRDYIREYRRKPWLTLIAFIAPAVGTIFVVFVPPLILERIINDFVTSGNISLSGTSGLIALLGAAWLFGEFSWRCGLQALIYLEASSLKALSNIAFRHIANRDYDFYANNFVGTLTVKARAFSQRFELFTDTLGMSVSNNVLPIIFASVVLWRYSPWIPLTLIACLVIVVTVITPLIRKRASLVAMRHDAGSKVAGRLSDVLTNMLAVKAFASEELEAKSLEIYLNDYSEKYKRAGVFQNLRIDATLSPMYVLTNVIGLVLAVVFASRLGLEAGAIVVIFTYYAQTSRVFWEINRVYRQIETAVSEAAEFTQLLLTKSKIIDKLNAKELLLKDARIDFANVNFKYHSGDKDADLFLSDFSLSIKPGESVGLVGPSGGGKTTITKLLLRFVDPESGKILIDGHDISSVSQSSLRKHISYVPQEPLLFHRSLYENIAYGADMVTKEDVIKASRIAHADDFISKLPEGYNTLVGERGIKLSGGQRQRIAIARALVKQAPILVLDEATSSLDSESEKYIQEGLKELMRGRTAIVIAHRLSTIKHLDRIVVLENGKIVQDGKHEELIKELGLYAKLWSHQSGEFIDEDS